MKKTILICLALLFLFNQCGKICIESRGIEGAGLTITFFNTAANEYFYPLDTITYLSPFKLDSLRIKDSNGNLLRTPTGVNSDPVNPLKGFNVVGIYPIYIPSQDAASFTNEYVKYIYIKYNHNTFDTIKLIYKAKKAKCANKFDYIKVYYKSGLIAEAYNSYYQGLTFTLNH
ncbi:MAG: hypothetical protein ACOVP7_02900 [Lacibacter sp.]